jgi:sugar lactone lactonase YvrE
MGSAMTGSARVLRDGLRIGESPRWHDGCLWVCNWGEGEILALAVDGSCAGVVDGPAGIPFCFDWLPDGRLLVVAGQEGKLVRHEADGSLAVHGDLGLVSHGLERDRRRRTRQCLRRRWRVQHDGRRAVPPGGDRAHRPDGRTTQVAADLHFPNGMALTPDDRTLIVAESYGRRLTAFDVLGNGALANRRVWAQLGDGVPDGICVDAEGAVWYADVPNRCCVRVAEGGEVLAHIEADRGCFACMLGGVDGRTLFIVAAKWRGPEEMFAGEPTGQVLFKPAPAPAAGRP